MSSCQFQTFPVTLLTEIYQASSCLFHCSGHSVLLGECDSTADLVLKKKKHLVFHCMYVKFVVFNFTVQGFELKYM